MITSGGTATLGLYDFKKQLDDYSSKADVTYVDNLVNSIGFGNRAYKTYVAMDADKANIPSKSKVTVTNDATESNNGDWQWDGVVFTKSAYDPLTQAKIYTDLIKTLLIGDITANKDLLTQTVLGLYEVVTSIDSLDDALRLEISTVSSSLLNVISNVSKNTALAKQNTDFITSLSTAINVIVMYLNEVKDAGNEIYKGLFKYNQAYAVGDSFTHASGKYLVIANVVSSSLTPDRDNRYKLIAKPDSSKPPLSVVSATVKPEVLRIEIPTVISKDGMTCWSVSSNVLYESKDFGETWTQLYSFSNLHFIDWVKELDNGELLLQVILFVYEGQTKVRDRYSIYRTEGKNTANIVMQECFTIAPEGVFANHAWSVSDYKNIILVGEYGAKYGSEWAGKYVPLGENARYVRMSLDYGKTWKVIFDLNAVVEVPNAEGVHVHGLCYDPYWNRIWLTHGDGFFAETATLYSDDLGKTWEYAQRYKKSDGSNTATDGHRHQNVGIIALPTCILFATDGYPDGVQRIDRAHGKHTSNGLYPIDIAYFKDVGQNSLSFVCSSISYASNTKYSPILFGFTAETNSNKSFLLGTYDGWEFFELWEDTLVQPTGKGLDFVCGVLLNNTIVIRSNDSRTTGTGRRTKITLTV